MYKIKIIFNINLIMLLFACNDAVNNSNTKYMNARSVASENDNSLFSKVKNIYASRCASCHATDVDWESEEGLAQSKWVVAGSTNNSKLYNSLKGSKGVSGRKDMPQGNVITAQELSDIETWILSLNNNGGSGLSSDEDILGDLPDGTPKVESAEFKAFIKLIDNKCVYCHKSGTNKNITSFEIYKEDEWAKTGLIIPKDMTSPIIARLSGTSNDLTADMPKDLPALKDFEIQIVQNWVNSLDDDFGGGEGTGGGFDLDFFNARNVLSNRCMNCHDSTNAQNQSGGFGIYRTAQEFVDNGFVIPGDAANSRLYIAVSGAMPAMPPEGQGNPLNENELQTIANWINGITP